MVAIRPRHDTEDFAEQLHARGIGPITLRLPEDWVLNNDTLLELCSLNETVPFEVDETGALILNMPSGHTSEWISMIFVLAIGNWMDQAAGDMVYGSGGLFELPDGNKRAPDAAWVSAQRMAGIDLHDGDPLQAVPDFVVEVRSRSDRISRLHEKMELWLRNGVRLAWLIDPFESRLWAYRPGAEAVELERPEQMSDEEVLPGLAVDLRRVWPSRFAE